MAMKLINPVEMARDACAAMTEPQRLAFALELVRDAGEETSVFHLMRVSTTAEATFKDIRRAAFVAGAAAVGGRS